MPFLLKIFDEFQAIGNLDDPNESLYALGSFRSVIQGMNCPVCFTGSIRHEMSHIFTNADSPFFKSSELLTVPSIPLNEMYPFIAKRFKQGKIEYNKDTFLVHYAATNGITGDVIALAKTIFDMFANNKTQTLDSSIITEAIIRHIEPSEGAYSVLLESLTQKQLDCALALANCGGTNPYSKSVLKEANIPNPGSMKRPLNGLLKKNIIFIGKNKELKFFDPFFAYWLQFNF